VQKANIHDGDENTPLSPLAPTGFVGVPRLKPNQGPGKLHTAAAYLKEKGLALTNFHDGDGQIESMLGPSPLPRELIVDQAGWVVVDAQLDENRLLSRLAELDPAFKEFAPKAQATPCVAGK
jgi:hypothetical protein